MQPRSCVGTHTLWEERKGCVWVVYAETQALRFLNPWRVEVETKKSKTKQSLKADLIKMQMAKFLDPEILTLGVYSREIFTSLHKSVS